MPQSLQKYIGNSMLDTTGIDTSSYVWINENEPNTFEHWTSEYATKNQRIEQEQNLPPLDFKLRNTELGSGLFSLYLLILVVWSLVYRKNAKSVDLIAKSMFSNNSLFQLMDSRGGLNSVFSVVLFLIGLLIFSIFTIQFAQVNQIAVFGNEILNSWTTIFLVFLIVVSLFFVKMMVLALSSWVFNEPIAFNTYSSINVVSIQFLGVLLFPITVLITYGHALGVAWLVNLGLLFLITVFGYRLIRVFFLALKRTNSQLFHIMLYICALEILPLLVASKWVFAFGAY